MLFGYDTGVINGSIRFVQMRYELSAVMKGAAASSALLACMFGAAFAGSLSDRFGRRKVLILSAVFFLVSAIGTALPRNVVEFIVFRYIGGLGVGAASMTSPMYIAEVSPARIRGRMVSVNELTIVGGMLIVYFVNYFIALRGDEAWNVARGWRWMFGSEAVPATIFLVLAYLVPESPRWLTKQGRKKEALTILGRVDGADFAAREMTQIEETISRESGSLVQFLPPSGCMPVGGYFFDTIVRQPFVDDDNLDPEDNLEEFTVLDDYALDWYRCEADRLRNCGRAVMAGVPKGGWTLALSNAHVAG